MNRILNSLIVITLILLSVVKVEAMTFEEAFTQSSKKPVVALVYAQWADGYQSYINTFRTVQKQFGSTFNFVEMDIASKDTKFFNSRYHIYPNVPYVVLYRDRGKVSRYIPRDCAADAYCMSSKLKTFIR